jgi:excisionase family DNA binding protein
MPRYGEPLWRIDDLAEYLAISAGEVQELVDSFGIPHLKIGEHLRFRKAEIDLWLDSLKSSHLGKVAAPQPNLSRRISSAESRTTNARNSRPYESSNPQWCQPTSPPYPRIEEPKKMPMPHLEVRVSEYRHLQDRLGELGELNGFRVTVDQPLPGEETPIEAVLERDAWKLACLIVLSLTINKDILKIKRCLCSGFDEAAIVLTSRRHVQQAEPLINQELTKEELARVHLLSPDALASYIEGIKTLVYETIGDIILRERMASVRDS